MCGICGQFNYRTDASVEPAVIQRMMQTIVHRGPDDAGAYTRNGLGLGFRRLSIIDLSTGAQPMSDVDRTTWVVFNGEIYNFRELRAELESHGYVFRTRCDTEVLVHGYRHWGERVLNRLNGMFGLAIWDEPHHKLILARDPMGIKPVYYALHDGRLLFGSEIRPIAAALDRRPDLDPTALNLFLRYRYTPSPYTLFSGIRKLAPGEMLVVQRGVAPEAVRWYDFDPRPFATMPTDADAAERLLELYQAAVRRHLISDVPVGLLLSGGVDSGLLLGLMRGVGADWPTFTVGYGRGFADDELDDAAATARMFGARHVRLELDRATFEDALPHIVGVMEEPIASSSMVPMYFVSERARQDVKVALIGQGPDELFGGYTRHLGVRYGAFWRRLPSALRAGLERAVLSLPRNEAFKRGVYALSTPDRLRRYQHVFSIQSGGTVDGLFRDGVLPDGAGDTILECWSDYEAAVQRMDELGGFQLLELRSALPDELLLYADKMSMRHALEVRVPYLDREVVEYVQRLGPEFKVRNGTRKWLHRQVCRNVLPAQILRRKKRGFAVNVVDGWFRESLASRMEARFRDDASLMYRTLRPDRVRRLMQDHLSGRQDNHKILFSLVVFEEWLRSM
jgi:asparagine synthase (glutamine-hydrolysing)